MFTPNSGRFGEDIQHYSTIKTFDCCRCPPQTNREAEAVLAHGKHGVLAKAVHVKDVQDLSLNYVKFT